MFCSTPQTKLAQRALGALRVARSFLLLEDDYEVDWEVGQDERTRVSHPHRAPLRGGCAQRRAGHVPARPQACLSPLGRALHASHESRERHAGRAARPAGAGDACSSGRGVQLDR
jgi:hypothetical protein